MKGIEKMIAGCRKKQLMKMHDSQSCIDKLDYLSYRLSNLFKNEISEDKNDL